jgi:hypothetical protein
MNHLAGFAIGLFLLGGLQEPKKYRLTFEPKAGDSMEIKYVHDTSWDYAEEDMKGELVTELDLRWSFDGAKADEYSPGRAGYSRVVYRGRGVKKGKDFRYDIEWTSKEGYLKGKDSEGDKQWAAAEIKEGLRLEVDNRAACKVGEC